MTPLPDASVDPYDAAAEPAHDATPTGPTDAEADLVGDAAAAATDGAASADPLAAPGPTGGRAAVRPGRLALGDDLGISPEVRRARWTDLDTTTAEGLFALRAAVERPATGTVAVVDEHDPEPSTEHVWVADVDGPVAALRVRPAAARDRTASVERLCVRADVRQLGLTSALLADVVSRYGGTALVADVPADATGTFARFGFEEVATVPDADAQESWARMRRGPDQPWRED